MAQPHMPCSLRGLRALGVGRCINNWLSEMCWYHWSTAGRYGHTP